MAEISDRITELLTKKTASLADIGTASIRANTGLTTFGEQLNKLRAGRLAEEKTLFDVLSKVKQGKRVDRRLDQADRQLGQADRRIGQGDRTLDQGDKRIGLAEKEFDLKEKKFKAASGSADQKAFEDAFKVWGKDLSKQDLADLYLHARDSKEKITAGNAHRVLADGVRKLGLRVPKKKTYKEFVKIGKGLWNIEKGDWVVKPKDDESYGHLKRVGKGLWNARTNKWAIEPTDDKESFAHFKTVGKGVYNLKDGKWEIKPPEGEQSYKQYKSVQGGLWDLAKGKWEVPPKDKASYDHLKLVAGGLWDAELGQWAVEPKEKPRGIRTVQNGLWDIDNGKWVVEPREKASTIAKYMDELEAAENSGDQERAGFIRARLEKLTTTPSRTVTVSSGDTTLTLTEGQAGKRGGERADAVEKANARIAEASIALEKLAITPSAAGVTGAFISGVGGLIEQIPFIGTPAGKWLGTTEVTETRSQLKTMIGQYVEAVTGDTSGRYSDRDVELTQSTLAIEDITKSYQQTVAALKTMVAIEQRKIARLGMTDDGLPDITYRDGQLKYMAVLVEQGASPADAAKEIRRLAEKYGIPIDGR